VFDLRDRVVVVTGASSGLGAQLACTLHALGAHVVLAARRGELLDELVDRLGGGLAVPADVTDVDDRHRIVSAALDAHGRIDVLVNNAGTAHPAPALDEPASALRDVLEVNLVAAVELSKLVARPMIAAGSGSIVNVASLSWARSLDRFALASYAASKAGLVAVTRELAAQWGRLGVRVNAVAPAWLPSEMTGGLEDLEQVAWISERNALGRPGRPHELDGAITFLASDAASYVTGQTLNVDGGWSVY